MASLKPIKIGDSKRIPSLWNVKKKGKVGLPTKANARETRPGYYNDLSLNYSSTNLGIDPKQRYK